MSCRKKRLKFLFLFKDNFIHVELVWDRGKTIEQAIISEKIRIGDMWRIEYKYCIDTELSLLSRLQSD